MSFFSDIPDGGQLRSDIKSALVEEIVSGIRRTIAFLRDRKILCRAGFILRDIKKADIEGLCGREIMEITAELLSKHYLLEIVDGTNKNATLCDNFVSESAFDRKYNVICKDYVGDRDTLIVVEIKNNDNIESMDELNLSENGNIRL